MKWEYLVGDFVQTTRAANIEAVDTQAQVGLVVDELAARVELLPFVDVLATRIAPHVAGRHRSQIECFGRRRSRPARMADLG